MKAISAILFVALMLAGLARADIIYGDQLYGQGAFIATKSKPDQMAVGAQINGWAVATSWAATPTWTFGAAVESVGWEGSNGYLIGVENMIGNLEPANLHRKVANNAVIHCSRPSTPCLSPNNFDSIAYWVSSDPGSGFGSAFKLDRNSIADWPGHHATVIDLEDLDPARNGAVVLFKLPGGREVTIAQFIRALDR